MSFVENFRRRLGELFCRSGYEDSRDPKEMIFVMIYIFFDMILGAYLIGNITALIVKGSKTERYMDKMSDIFKYLSRNKLGKDIRTLIKNHLRLQYECSYTDSAVLQDLPIFICVKVPNDFGCGLGILQLILYAIYYRDEGTKKTSDKSSLEMGQAKGGADKPNHDQKQVNNQEDSFM